MQGELFKDEEFAKCLNFRISFWLKLFFDLTGGLLSVMENQKLKFWAQNFEEGLYDDTFSYF